VQCLESEESIRASTIWRTTSAECTCAIHTDDYGSCMLPQGVKMQHIELEPYALHPFSFAHAMPGMTKAVSAAIFKDLQAAKLIDKEGYGRFPAYNDEKHMCDLKPVFETAGCECGQLLLKLVLSVGRAFSHARS